jgi:hypothetical protein
MPERTDERVLDHVARLGLAEPHVLYIGQHLILIPLYQCPKRIAMAGKHLSDQGSI